MLTKTLGIAAVVVVLAGLFWLLVQSLMPPAETTAVRVAVANAPSLMIVDGPGESLGPIPMTQQFVTGWKQLRVGMSGSEVASRLGGDWNFSIRTRDSENTSWSKMDRSKGFEQLLWFNVEFERDARTGRWGSSDKSVDWHVLKWDGFSPDDHYDVTGDFR